MTRFGHLLDAWMDALPGLRALPPDTVASTDSAGNDAFDFGAAVPGEAGIYTTQRCRIILMTMANFSP